MAMSQPLVHGLLLSELHGEKAVACLCTAPMRPISVRERVHLIVQVSRQLGVGQTFSPNTTSGFLEEFKVE